METGSVLTFDTRLEVLFDLLLDMVHHGYSSDQNNGRNELVRVKAGVEEAPGDAYRSEGLHHFKVARCRSARDMQPLKINQKRNPA